MGTLGTLGIDLNLSSLNHRLAIARVGSARCMLWRDRIEAIVDLLVDAIEIGVASYKSFVSLHVQGAITRGLSRNIVEENACAVSLKLWSKQISIS